MVAALALGIAFGEPAQGAVDEAQAAFDRGHYATAMRAWRVRAALGDASAQTNVGYLYEQGLSVRQDYAEALKWYRRAAEASSLKPCITSACFITMAMGWRRMPGRP